ncbi:MAG: hypothetical protein ABI383_14045 [Acidobacteriaceae bacterium]
MQIEITGRTEQIIREQMERGGYRTPEEVVDEALNRLGMGAGTAPLPPPKRLSAEEFQRNLDEIARFSDEMPVLDPAAFSRESIYEDRD